MWKTHAKSVNKDDTKNIWSKIQPACQNVREFDVSELP